MKILRTLLIIILGVYLTACGSTGERKEGVRSEPFPIDFACIDKCKKEWETCRELADKNFQSCTGGDCDELFLDEKFKCNADKAICIDKC